MTNVWVSEYRYRKALNDAGMTERELMGHYRKAYAWFKQGATIGECLEWLHIQDVPEICLQGFSDLEKAMTYHKGA